MTMSSACLLQETIISSKRTWNRFLLPVYAKPKDVLVGILFYSELQKLYKSESQESKITNDLLDDFRSDGHDSLKMAATGALRLVLW